MADIPTKIIPLRPQQNDAFYAVQDADSATEAEIEKSLLLTTGRIYMEQNIITVKFAVLGALETAKNFLLKYQDSIKPEILEDIDMAIMTLRMGELDREAINSIYQIARDEILFTLGVVLGFRKSRRPQYKWTDKLIERSQI